MKTCFQGIFLGFIFIMCVFLKIMKIWIRIREKLTNDAEEKVRDFLLIKFNAVWEEQHFCLKIKQIMKTSRLQGAGSKRHTENSLMLKRVLLWGGNCAV